MENSKIRWTDHTWNPIVGCTKVSEGCDFCYAETITTRFGPKSTAFPNGFDPTFKPIKLTEPARWMRKDGPARVFVNSLSDLHHEAFTDDQRDAIYSVMLEVPHDYIVLTKRPKAMAEYLDGFMRRLGLAHMPPNIWLGTSIELDKYCGMRTRWLTSIPAVVRFLSLEPLLGPLPSLSLDGIDWVIVGGESGPGHRPMDHQWARDLRDQCIGSTVAFFFKQSSAARTEQGIELDGKRWEQFPLEHPADRLYSGRVPLVSRYQGRHADTAPRPA
jgi:protein gp37